MYLDQQLRTYPSIGDVLFRRSRRAKRMNISLKPFEPVRLTLPINTSIADGERFLAEKTAWILKSQKKVLTVEEQNTFFTKDTEFSTRWHKLELKPDRRQNFQVSIREGKVVVCYPYYLPEDHEQIQQITRKGLERAWEIEAKAELPARVEQFAIKHGFSFQSVSIRNTKTRWGSCSHDNRINLSLHLMRLPDHLVDYVILHELCHTKVKNHSATFWLLLQEVSGNARGLDQEISQHRAGFY